MRLPARDSVQVRLLAWLFAALAVLVSATLFHAYREALAAANTAYDRSLLAVARVIAERVDLEGGRVTVEVPYVALDFFEADLRGRVFYKVSGLEGEYVSGFDDLPALPPDTPRSQEYFALAHFHDAVYRGEPVRMVGLYQPVGDDARRGMAIVQVAETKASRDNVTQRLLRGTLLRELLLVALVAIVIVMVVRAALRPVERLGRELNVREAADLSPLDPAVVPAEVRPVVEGMNDYMRRLRELLEAQERFIADASHQLRTPLTVIKTQTEVALREPDPGRMRETVAAIHQSVSDTVRLANQLLGHARARYGAAHGALGEADLASIARQAALDLAPVAVAKEMDLAYEGPEHASIAGDAVLLQEMTRNLLDNAIRYGPRGGAVSVRVTQHDGTVLEVDDSGPGIAPAERERVFEPFVRGESAPQPGAGLGLTIARDVARAHGARIELADRPGGGFRVRVVFAALSPSRPGAPSPREAGLPARAAPE